MKTKSYLLVALFITVSSVAMSGGFWARGDITEYHVQTGRIVVELNNLDDSRCGGYNWYGDYSITIPDPSTDPRGALIFSAKSQALFDHFRNDRPVGLYVNESGGYCEISTVTYDGN